MQHIPLLYIPDNILDCRVLEIWDISLYDSNIAITNPVIEIQIPGKDSTCIYSPIFKIKGRNHFTSNTFGLTSATCSSDLDALPDGIYDIKYSVCPNETVFYHTKILRDCQSRSEILGKLSTLLGDECQVVYDIKGNDITSSKVNDLKDLLIILDGAKVDMYRFKYSEAEAKLNTVSDKIALL